MVLQFIKKVLLFLIPLLLLFIALELYLDLYPNSFNKKADYLNNNKDVEVLFLGSSHTQNAINPEYFNGKMANLAYGNQDYTLDNALFFKYVEELENLRFVFLEMDYHNLEDKNGKDYFRKSWYKRYYGIEHLDVGIFDELSLYHTNPGFFNNYLMMNLNPNSYPYHLNEYGFITNDDPGIFMSADYNTDYLIETGPARLGNRHAETSMAAYNHNKTKINEIINFCVNENITVVLVSYPVFQTYRNNYVVEKIERKNRYLDSVLSAKKEIKYLDFEENTQFKVTDYKNDDHLNSKGSIKLSKIVNDSLTKWLSDN